LWGSQQLFNAFEGSDLLIADDISELLQKCHFAIRKPPFYPLNYGNIKSQKLEGWRRKSRDQIWDVDPYCKTRAEQILCCAVHRISAISRLRLGTSSLRKTEWRCFFTIGKLKQASSAISWLLRPSQTSRATSCSRLVSRTRWDKWVLAGPARWARSRRKSSHSMRKCGCATPIELSCFWWIVARKCGDRGWCTRSSLKLVCRAFVRRACVHCCFSRRHRSKISDGIGDAAFVSCASSGPFSHTAQKSRAARFW